MRRLAIVAVGLALVATFFMWSTSSVPVGPTWAQAPTPLPGGGLDKTLAYDVSIGNHVWGTLGAFNHLECHWAVVYVAAALDEPEGTPGSFDLQACSSDNPDTITGACRSLGNSIVLPYPMGTWTTYLYPPEDPPRFVPSDLPYVHFRVFSNQAGRYVVEAHCRPTYPSELPTPTPTPLGAVGGIAELPPLASAPGGSGMGGTTYAVLAGAAAGVLAFAVLVGLSVKRRSVR